MTHAHEILHMMEGNSYADKEALIAAIVSRFGAEARFHTCSVEGYDARQIVDFLAAKGKFKPAGEAAFTVDLSKMCHS